MRLLIYCVFSLGLLVWLPSRSSPPKDENLTKELKVFGEVFQKVRQNYVKDIPIKDLVSGAVKGMLSSLDKNSRAVVMEDYKNLTNEIKGVYYGVGMELYRFEGLLKVLSPIDDSPAFRGGIKPGDIITHVNGDFVRKIGPDQAIKNILGAPKTSVTLSILRDRSKLFDVKLLRARISNPTAKHRIEDDTIIYLRIASFMAQNTGAKLREAFRKAMQELKGKKPTGVILDLRNNPGGLLDQGIEVAGLFLDGGLVVSSKGRVRESNKRYFAKRGDMTDGLPIVVLSNKGSASSSEIVMGAIQDHKRGLVVGTTTYGKGSVQTVMPVPPFGAIVLTTSLFHTPSGRAIPEDGIKPDIFVPVGTVKPLANGWKKEKKKGDKKQPAKPSVKPKSAKKDGPSTAAAILQNKPEERDYQLESAKNVLKAMVWKTKLQIAKR